VALVNHMQLSKAADAQTAAAQQASNTALGMYNTTRGEFRSL